MQFSKISLALLSFAAFSSGSPLSYNELAVRDASPAKRGLIWTPRQVQARDDRGRGGNRNRNRNNIIIAQPINIQLNQIQIVQEVQIINVIQNLIIVNGLEDAKDNIRRNHYRNRNRNRNDDINTVVIVVVVVVDARDSSNQNLRYLTRQVESNPEAQTKEWVVVTEQSTITVDSQNPTAGVLPTATEASAIFPTGAVPQIGTYDPNAALAVGSDALLPAGIAAPSYESRGAKSDRDPAIIIEADQVAFVVFDDDNDNRGDGRGKGNGRGDGRDD